MFRALFARLTGEPSRGESLFGLAVAEARRTDWFVEGEVPDTVNGRFAVLATIIALMTLRLEREGADGQQASAALTERLVESLDAEIREMGVGDPTLGKQVRRLVGAVAGRVERLENIIRSGESWTSEVQRSIYLDEPPTPGAIAWRESEVQRLWERFVETNPEELLDGRMR